MTTFTTERVIPTSPSTIFEAIQNADRLARWWGPKGFSNTFDTFDFQPGGRWVFTMHGPDGKDYLNESVFETIVPNNKVVIRHACAPLFRLTITLNEHPEGTLLLWEQAFDEDSVANAIRHIVEPANEQNLDRLCDEVRATAPVGS